MKHNTLNCQRYAWLAWRWHVQKKTRTPPPPPPPLPHPCQNTIIPVKSYVFSVSLMDFQQFSSLTAYGKDLTYFREKNDEIRKSVAMVRLGGSDMFFFLDVVIFYIFVGFLSFLVKTYGLTIIILWSESRIAWQVCTINSLTFSQHATQLQQCVSKTCIITYIWVLLIWILQPG